jgi:protein-L-isoaspartate(D-aspartate) O-methyltransferase
VDRLEAHRHFYADLVTTSAGAAKNERLKDAFASTPRERFVGAGPWKVFAGGNYVETPTDDPAFLYQDVVVALAPERRINNGQPVLHAINLAALKVTLGEAVVHIGAGTGYYTAVLARLTGATGTVVAYEVEHDLAQSAIQNLSDFSNVTVQQRSGSEAPLPVCDAIYVNAAATAPLNVWLDALQLNGRLLFPLTPADGPGGIPGAGGMLLVARNDTDRFDARFVCPTMFVSCVGARDEETAQKLSVAFKRGDFRNVRSLWRNSQPDDTCWCAGNGWWLSSA